MNLKKLAMASIFVLMGGCNEADVDAVLIDKIWIETVKTVGIDSATQKPEVIIMKEDLYRKILRKNCESKSGGSKEECLRDRKELEASVLAVTGKNYTDRYSEGISSERKFLYENCEAYADKGKRRQCESDKHMKINAKVLARAYLPQRYIEIFYYYIQSISSDYDKYYQNRYHLSFSYAQSESFFYGIIAHEMLHIAMHIKNIPTLDHHQLMKDKYMDPLLKFINEYEKSDRDGFHRDMIYIGLDAGIAGDEAAKRIINRITASEPGSEDFPIILPCGLRIH